MGILGSTPALGCNKEEDLESRIPFKLSRCEHNSSWEIWTKVHTDLVSLPLHIKYKYTKHNENGVTIAEDRSLLRQLNIQSSESYDGMIPTSHVVNGVIDIQDKRFVAQMYQKEIEDTNITIGNHILTS